MRPKRRSPPSRFCSAGSRRNTKHPITIARALKALPILIGGVSAGSADVGDGLLWLHGVDVSLYDVTIDNSSRASVLIDGQGTGLLDDVVLTGGDAELGILLQNYLGGAQPSTTGTTPPITTTSQEVHPIPFSPQLE